MTRDELILKLADLEWEDFEVKLARAELPKDTWKTVSAFSNTSGGWLVLYVEEAQTSGQHGKKSMPCIVTKP